MLRTIAVSACLALCAMGSAAGGSAGRSACPSALPNELASTGSATQLVTVVAPRRSSTNASLQLWRRSGLCWLPVAGPWTAWVGQQGVNPDKHEGDRTTPAGAFGFGRVMYGVGPNPGVRYPIPPDRLRRLVGRGSALAVLQPLPPHALQEHAAVSDHERRHGGSPTAYRHFAFIRYNADPSSRAAARGSSST